MTATAPREERPQRQRSERRAISLFQPDIVRQALIDSLIKLDPRVQIRNPVMFVVEIGAVITTVTWFIQVFGGKALRRQRSGLVHVHDLGLAVADRRVRQHGRGVRRGPRPRAGRHAALDAPGDRRPARGRDDKQASELDQGRRRGGRGRRADPGRRHRDRGHRLGRRVRDHGRVGAGHPRVRRGPQRGYRRHPGALGPDRRRDHPGARPVLPGPDDRAGRGRRAAQDAERDRPEHPPGRPDPDLHDRGGDAPPVRAVRRHLDLGDHADLSARRADPDDDRGAVVARSGSPAWTGWCAATCSR